MTRFHTVKRTAVVAFEGGIDAARRAKKEGRSLGGAPIRISWAYPWLLAPPAVAAPPDGAGEVEAAHTPPALASLPAASADATGSGCGSGSGKAVGAVRPPEPECTVCFEPMDAKIVLAPCGHVLCDDCAPKHDECPLCRAPVTARIRLFY